MGLDNQGSNPIPGSYTESLYSSDILSFLWHLKKLGYAETTIRENYSKILKNLSKHCNLNDPEAVKAYVAMKHVSSGRKELIMDCYLNYCKFKGVNFFDIPRYKRSDSLPYVPLETEIEALIAALPRKLRVFTKLIKETGARPGEIWFLTWKDIDFCNNIVFINCPEKGSKARAVKVSSQVISLISQLPKKSTYVFRPNPNIQLKNFLRYYIRERRRISSELCNPKLLSINWKSLRHFKGTMEYHRTKDILHVKEVLGHKNIQNTLVYTHLVNWETDEYICKVAKTVEDATKLIESGFEYITEMDQVKLFRKRR